MIDVWKGGNWQDEMASVAAAGFHSVLSAPFYLNYISYGEDWPKYYQTEPSNFTGGAKADSDGLISGLEGELGHLLFHNFLCWISPTLALSFSVCMWSEFVDAANFAPREWPRAAAVGERAWSPKSVTDVSDARHRLHEFRCKLLSRGIPAEPITNGGNAEELENHNYCPLEWKPHYQRPWDEL